MTTDEPYTRYAKRKKTRDEQIALFMQRVEKVDTGCWIWTRSVTTRGYGQWTVNGVKHNAHRWSYETFNGPLIDGMQIGHKCDVKRCVNPEHLEQITPGQNVQDGYDRGLSAAWNSEITHCKRGHELPPRVDGRRRVCVPCRIDRERGYRAAARIRRGEGE